MDPNVSTQVPSEYTRAPLGEPMDLSIKFYAFGTMALVISLAIGYGMYLVFFRERHRAKKQIRYEKEARDLENGILPKSRHYGIGKVPGIRDKRRPLPARSSEQRQKLEKPSFSNPFEPSSNASPPTHASSSPLPPQSSPRSSWASDATVSLAPPPKALTSKREIRTGSFR